MLYACNKGNTPHFYASLRLTGTRERST